MKKNEKGAALILVIIVMVVVSILGAALLTTSLADAKHAIRQENVIQANYLARAAVDDIAEYVLDHGALPVLATTSKTLPMGNYTIDSMTSNLAGSIYVIRATGNVEGLSSTVEVTITEATPDMILIYAIYTYANLNIEQMKVNGDIGSNGTITYSTSGSNTYDLSKFTAYPGKEIPYDQVTVSTAYSGGTTVLTAGENEVISASQNYDEISVVGNGDVLTFDTGLECNVLTVGVRKLEVGNQSSVVVTGEGMLRLYVYGDAPSDPMALESKGSFYLDNTTGSPELELFVYNEATAMLQTPLSLNPTDDPNMIRIYLGEDATLHLQANGNYNCYVIGPEANVVMQSSQTTVNGSVIGNILDGNGNKPAGVVNFLAPTEDWYLADAPLIKVFYRNP